MLKLKNKLGFTLVELVVVIAVFAILAAIAIPVVTNIINNATLNTALNNKVTINNCIAEAKVDVMTRNQATYGVYASYGTVTVGQVIRTNGISDACNPQTYYSREIIPVWNSDTGKVVVVYTDDYTDVENGNLVVNYISISDVESTLVADLPMT